MREILRMTSQHSTAIETMRAQHDALGEIMKDYLARTLESVSVYGHEEKGAAGETMSSIPAADGVAKGLATVEQMSDIQATLTLMIERQSQGFADHNSQPELSIDEVIREYQTLIQEVEKINIPSMHLLLV